MEDPQHTATENAGRQESRKRLYIAASVSFSLRQIFYIKYIVYISLAKTAQCMRINAFTEAQMPSLSNGIKSLLKLPNSSRLCILILFGAWLAR